MASNSFSVLINITTLMFDNIYAYVMKFKLISRLYISIHIMLTLACAEIKPELTKSTDQIH